MMNVDVDRTTLLLGECDVLSLTDAVGAIVTVRTGRVWITQELDTTDYVVRPGERFSIRRTGCTVLQSFGEVEVSVDQTSVGHRVTWVEERGSFGRLERSDVTHADRG